MNQSAPAFIRGLINIDSESELPFEEALEFAQRSGVSVFPLSLSSCTENKAQKKSDLWRLKELDQIAEATDGLSFHVAGRPSLHEAFLTTGKDLRTRYRIT